jgi:multidrug resistance efflux pump
VKIQFDSPPPVSGDGLPVKYLDSKRHVPRWRWWLLLAFVLALPLSFLLRAGWSTMAKRSPAFVMREQVVLRAPVTAWVQEIPDENTQVQQDMIVAQLTRQDVAIPPAAGVKNLESADSLAQERVRVWADQLRKLEALAGQGAATRQEVENARLQWLAAQEDAEATRRSLTLARHSPSQVSTLLSPLSATVIRRFAQEGEWVQAGEELLLLQTQKAPWIEAYLSPEQVRFAIPGQRVLLLFMNGYRADAVVENVLLETQRLPSERLTPLEAPSSAVVVSLRPLAPLPPDLQVHRLPLDIRFPLF